jgi:superfamily II DNA or RNA helicase
MVELFDYQIELKAKTLKSLENNHSVLAQLPTGGGKSHTAASITADWVNEGKRTLVLAHRTELLIQLKESFGQHFDDAIGWMKAGKVANYKAPVQLGSVGSVMSRADAAGHFDRIIVDECHRSCGDTYQQIFRRWNKAKLLGFTATPCRLDGKPLGDIYDDLKQGVSVKHLINIGRLTPYDICLDPNPMRTGGRSMGEFKKGDLEDLNNIKELTDSAVHQYLEHAYGKSNLGFTVSIEHAKIMAAGFNAAGVPAAYLAGDCNAAIQKDVMTAFRVGEIKALFSVELYTEGIDIPGLECVQICRPTMSLSKYLQMLGRVLRVSPGKERAIILDHTNNWDTHGFADDDREWSLTGKPKNIRKDEEEKIKDENDKKKRQEEALILAAKLEKLDEEKRDALRARKAARELAIKELELANKVILRPTGKRLEVGARNMALEPQPQGSLRWWEWEINRLILTQKSRGYQPMWVAMSLLGNYYAPHPAWLLLAEKLGYQKGWAWHKFSESQNNRVVDSKDDTMAVSQTFLDLGELRDFKEPVPFINF